MKPAWAYVRVSTQEQSDLSPDAQLREIKAEAKKQGFFIDLVFIDEGESAKTANRPEFLNMIAMAKIKPKPTEAIFVHKTDRFARNREDAITYKSLLRKECGIQVISVKENFDDSPMGMLIEGIMEVIAEFYSLNLAQEVKKGMTEKALRGGNLTRPAYGYQLAEPGKAFEVVPEEAEIVRIIFQLYAEEKMGFRKIARHLNETLRIYQPQKIAVKGKRKGKVIGGNPWDASRIRYIISNPLYVGKIRWNKHDSANGYAIKSKEEWIFADGQHPPIIDEELWRKAEERHARNQPTQGEASEYLFGGMIKCGGCGKSLTANRKKEKRNGKIMFFPFYNCSSYLKGSGCKSHFISVKNVDRLVIEHIKDAFESDEPINFEIVQQDNTASFELTHLKKELSQTSEMLERANKAYLEGIDTLEEYTQKKTYIRGSEQKILNRIKEIEKSNDKKSHERELRKKLKKLYIKLIDPDLDIKEKKNAVAPLISQVIFSKDTNQLIVKYLHKP